MDLSETIAELLEEKQKLDQVIAALEELASGMTSQPALTQTPRQKIYGGPRAAASLRSHETVLGPAAAGQERREP